MKIREFLKEHSLFIAINITVFIMVSCIMLFARMGFISVFFIGCVWFLPCGTYMVLEYTKYSTYIRSLQNYMENLDQKYLLPEVIKDTDNYVEKEINDILKEVSRDMHEHVNLYKNQQQEYKEYIEMWVHEIKTPIASSRLVIENNKSDVTGKLDVQLYRIESFVEQVLYYARSEEVNKDYIIREIELWQIVNSVVKRNYRDFISRKISLKLEKIEGKILCDSKWIEFILNQIITNSIKYSRKDMATIKIHADRVGDIIALSVEDNGVGISDTDINRVFERGFTGKNGRVFGKSTGMGLYICKKLCKKLNVGIKLISEEEKGTRVTLYFNNKRVI